jgi:hypothetical protein
MSLRIDAVEIDDGNADHLTQHGGVRVNFRYRPGVARPISAWRLG